jgi:hypothetical protein
MELLVLLGLLIAFGILSHLAGAESRDGFAEPGEW